MYQSLMWWLVGAGFALVVGQLALYWSQRKLKPSKPSRRLPPGPKPKPVVGNLGDMEVLSHQQFARLSTEYGPLVHMRMGSVPFIVGNTSDMAREILKTKDKIFASRAPSTGFKELAYDQSSISTSPQGPRWRTLRKIFVSELLTPKRINDFEDVRKAEAISLVKVLLDDSKGGKPAQIGVKLKDHVANVMTSLMMSKKFFGPHADEAMDSIKFQSMYQTLLNLLGAFHFGDFIPFLKRWDIQGHKKKMRKVHITIDGFLQAQFDERRQKFEQGDRKQNEGRTDFLDVLLTRSGENDEHPMTNDMYKSIIQDTILGGVETTTGSIEWTLAELIKNPEKMRKVQEELDRVVGRERLVEESDIKNLHYMNAAIKEGFRMHPATPLLIPHCATEDSEIAGFDIPAKSTVCVNVWAIGRDPQLWENPSEFSPERFLGSPIDASGRCYELLPFGSGRRQCPGYNYGLASTRIFIASVLQGCQFTASPGQTLESMDMTEGIGMVNRKAFSLEAIVVPRLPQHVITASGVL